MEETGQAEPKLTEKLVSTTKIVLLADLEVVSFLLFPICDSPLLLIQIVSPDEMGYFNRE